MKHLRAASVFALLLTAACVGDHERAVMSTNLIGFDSAVIELARRNTGLYPLPGYSGPVDAVRRAIPVPREFPVVDDWGDPILYFCTPDGQHHILLSCGSDGRPDSPLTWPYKTPFALDLEDPRLDTVICDGTVVRMQLSFDPGGPSWQSKDEKYLRHVVEGYSDHFRKSPPNDPLRHLH